MAFWNPSAEVVGVQVRDWMTDLIAAKDNERVNASMTACQGSSGMTGFSLWKHSPVPKRQRFKHFAVNQKGQGSNPVW